MGKGFGFLKTLALSCNIISLFFQMMIMGTLGTYFSETIAPLFVLPLVLLNLLFFFFWLFRMQWPFILFLVSILLSYPEYQLLYSFPNNAIQTDSGLKILTYNVRLFNEYQWINTDAIPNQIARFIAHENPDIVCFQEFSKELSPSFASYPYLYFKSSKKGGKNGTCIMSKIPLQKKGVVPFEDSSNNGIFAEVKWQKKLLRIYNMHFESFGLGKQDSLISKSNPFKFKELHQSILKKQNGQLLQFDLFQKFNFKLPKDQLLMINIQYSESSNIDRYDKLVEEKNGSLRFSEWYYGPQKRLFISPQFKFFLGKKWMKKGTMTFAYQKVDESRVNRKFGEISRSNKLESVNVLSLNTDFFGYLKGGHSFSYGLEWTHNKINSEAYAFDLELDFERITGFSNLRPITSRYPDNGSSANSFAVYLNWIYEPNKRTTLNAGLRLTSSSLKGDWNKIASVDKLLSSVELDSEALTYTIAVTFRPNKKLQINSLLSSGFRNPNIDDIGKIRESSGILLVPNSFLKPEYAYTFESGIKIRSNNQKSYLDLRGFSTLVSRHIVRSDFIVFSDTSTKDQNTIIYNGDEVLTQANKNLGNRFIYGICLDGKLSLNSFIKLYGGVNFTSSDKNSDYGPMPSIAPFFGTFTFSSKYRKWSNFLIWKFSGSKKPLDYSWGGEDGLNETPNVAPDEPLEIDRFYGIPSWNIFSLLNQYYLKENIRLTFGLNNIFDIHYRTFASGISSEGRSFQLGVKVKF